MTGSKTHKDHAIFLRVVATLFALAKFLDRVSDFPRPVRAFVLWVLRPAEAITREFVLEFAQDYGFRPTLSEQLFLEDHDSSDAALRLAWRFYTLAQLLEEVLEYVDFSVDEANDPQLTNQATRKIRHCARQLNNLLRELQRLPCWPVRIPDT